MLENSEAISSMRGNGDAVVQNLLTMISVAANPNLVRAQTEAKVDGLNRYIPLAVWLISVLTLIWIPLKIISYGYLPPDDALRHAAKAVSEREWSDVLVIRPEFQIDHNPGWHWLLGQIHQLGNISPDALVTLAVVGLFVLALVLPITTTDRPEAWVGALLISIVAFPSVIHRILLGRPFALTIAVTLLVLSLWSRRQPGKPTLKLLMWTTILLALSAWIHGSWYLFSVAIAAFFLAGQRQSAVWLFGCWVAGSVFGALLTGHPIAFLLNAIQIGITCFQDAPFQRMLVTEFLPSGGNIVAVFTVVALLLWRHASGRWSSQCLGHPAFILAVLGWLLGLKVGRFETDWAAPGLLLWIALELREHVRHYLPFESTKRLVIATGLSAALLFAVTADENSRWTRALNVEFLSAEDPEMAAWLPEKDGILYSADMTVFYQTFYKNPRAPWRYILGFEATFMPPEDLKIFRNIQRNYGAFTAYEPWVKKMQPADRLVIRGAAGTAPNVPGLEWHYTARETWIGRIPRSSQGTGASAQSAAPNEFKAANHEG